MLPQFLTAQVFGFFVVFARLGAAFVALPGFSAAYVPIRMRLLIALAITFAVAPLLMKTLPGLPATPAALGLLILGEVLVGGLLGAIGRIIISALHVAGTVVAYSASMANAFIQDPVAEQQGSIMSGFLTTVGLLMIFVSGLHHVMLRAVVESYAVFVPGQMLPLGDMANLVADQVASSFTLGVQLASPFIVYGLMHYLLLGILGRLMPNLPVFFFGLPIQLAVQISLLMLALSGIMIAFTNHFASDFGRFVGG